MYKVANASNPNMGLHNKICNNPKYWCRKHQVYLSEKDVDKRKCKNKITYDMISTIRCTNLEDLD